jgi:hypothetical protein
MTRYSKTRDGKASFPTAIFLIIFIIQLIAAAGGICSYFYSNTKSSIADIEKYTINYSKTMAEAFASVAELSYRTKNYSALKSLFREKIEENTIDEAFFVLQNGTLIVHSNTTTEKRLRGNIANDEMSYNLDMILQPVKSGSRELFFSNYNIIDKKIPFNRSEREIIQKYLYKDINTSGWLFTKAVFHKNKPVGSLNFIVDKGRIYNLIYATIDNIQKSILIAAAASFLIALTIALIIMIRFRKTQVSAEENYEGDDTPEDILFEDDIEISLDGDKNMSSSPSLRFDDENNSTLYDEIDLSIGNDITPLNDEESGVSFDLPDPADEDDEYITIELLGELEDEPPSADKKKSESSSGGLKTIASVVVDDAVIWNKKIPDAIPVRKEK